MQTPPHIAMLESGGWGGICHYTYNLSQSLARAGCRVTLISSQRYELETLPRDFELKAAISPDGSYQKQIKCVAAHLRTLRPDLLHIQNTLSARKDWLPLLVLKRFRQPVIFTAHNVLPHDREERNAFGMRFAFGLIYALTDAIVIHSENVRKELQKQFNPSHGKIAVIPHGDYTFAARDRRTTPAEAKAWFGVPAGARLILSFGAIRTYKGVPDLIEAFVRVAGAVPDAYLAIVGKPIGIDVEAYREHVRQRGLDHRIIFRPGYVAFDDIERCFQAADITVFPYRAIAQSGALQLAYAFAKPVVVTNVGALPETVRDGENGFIVPPSDPPALADALVRLLNLDRVELSRMGQHSLTLAQTQHSWDDIAAQTIKLYTRVLSKNVA